MIKNSSKVYYTGSEWETKNYGKIKILGKSSRFIMSKEKKLYRYYICEFQDGTTIESLDSHIRSGYVRNPNARTIYGVGCLGEGKWVTSENYKITQEYLVWSEMIRRCYAPNAPEKFPAYKNVSVCERWHNYQIFCEDIQFLEGYDEWKRSEIKYHLDKDILCAKKGVNPKIYSLETCMFVTQRENISESTSRKNLTGLTYIGVSPKGIEHEFTNQQEFAKEYGLNNTSISECVNQNQKQHKGWTFKIKF